MDDRLIQDYRRDRDPKFARELRERLRRQDGPLHSPAVRRVLAAACAVAVVVAVFAIPSVRVSAESFLELFRVRRFAAVPFKQSRMETLRAMGEKRELLVFDRKEEVHDPGPPRFVASREAASSEAGFAVSVPSYLPEGLATDSTFVQGAGEVKFSISEEKLRSLLQQLDVTDVQVPKGLDGRWIEVRKPPVVVQNFRSPQNQNRRAALIQAKSPEVSVPAGWDVERLAEIGLRVLGLDGGEARRIARATDWRSTLLVPIPMNANTFRQVTVHRQPGLLITTTANGADRRASRVLLWSEGDRVFCIQGTLNRPDTIQMAESVS